MENIIVIILIVAFFVYLASLSSSKKTKRERYGEAVGKIASAAADTVSQVAFELTEPASKKKIRLAQEMLANRNGRIYRFESYSRRDELNRYLTIDNKFKQALDVLGLSEDRWKTVAIKLFYIGVLRKESREWSDYSKKNERGLRERILSDVDKDFYGDKAFFLNEAFEYFRIPKNQWIEYGDTVVEMYNLHEDKDLVEYGLIQSIMPMKNNKHLL